jgi:GT2 family glycosyltransferase
MAAGIGNHLYDFDVSVVMACYTEERIDSIEAALASLREQKLEPRKVIVAVDNNVPLADRLKDEFDWVTVVLNRGDRGASATRNRGAELVESRYTAFLDDDETASPDWLFELMQPFCDSYVVGCGGKYEARWSTGKPVWFPDEFAWAVGGAYEGMPTVTSPVRNVWSGNMAVRTDVFWSVGGFRTHFGKRGSSPQPEDTDLCIRMAAATGGHWMYVPSAIINHDVPNVRASLGFFISRCFTEGLGKGLMAKKLKSASAIDTERDYVRAATRAALRRIMSRRWLQGMVILLGLTSAAAGYLLARLGYGATRDDKDARRQDCSVADCHQEAPDLQPRHRFDRLLRGSVP